MQLVIGNKNYSSWSLRPWALLKYFEVEFSEKSIWLFSDSMKQELTDLSPNMKVPVLIDEDIVVWDSLAICEYINEQYLKGKAIPVSVKKRAEMRSICAEMHSGFFALRDELPMNCRRLPSNITLSVAAKADVVRVIALLNDALQVETNDRETNQKEVSKPFLFGDFSIADAFYLPIISRFQVYNIDLPDLVADYQQVMLQLPFYKQWLASATREVAIIKQAEV